MTLVAGPVGAFDSASVAISSGEDADPGVSNAAAGAAAALRARNQGPLRGIIAGGPTGWEEGALNGIAKEVVCSMYSIRSVKGAHTLPHAARLHLTSSEGRRACLGSVCSADIVPQALLRFGVR